MVLHRARITRIIAAILTLALSTQVAEAQVVSCTISGAHANDDHGGMIQPQHRAQDTGAAATRTGSDNQSSETPACSQTMLCANVAAVPTPAMRAFHFDNAGSPISFAAGVLELRAFRPDPPPPRV